MRARLQTTVGHRPSSSSCVKIRFLGTSAFSRAHDATQPAAAAASATGSASVDLDSD